MTRFDGTLARQLEFGEVNTGGPSARPAGLKLAPSRLALRGPDKYRILERRRRKAQIAARRILDLLD